MLEAVVLIYRIYGWNSLSILKERAALDEMMTQNDANNSSPLGRLFFSCMLFKLYKKKGGQQHSFPAKLFAMEAVKFFFNC